MTASIPLSAVAAIFCTAVVGVWLLRRAWRLKVGKAPWRWGGLSFLVSGVLSAALALGGARGPFIALTLLSVAAFGVIASGYTVRPVKAARTGREGVAPEPAERAHNVWRTALRWLLAGPLGMVAAMAIGVSYAAWAPGEPQTRVLIGGLIVPIAWGGAMAWTLADSRVLRATAVLIGATIAGFGAAMLKGFA